MSANSIPDEATSLLRGTDTAAVPIRKDPDTWLALRVVTAVSLLVFALEVSSAIADSPQTQILEAIVCEKYYATSSWTLPTAISSERCKIEAIQTEVALLIGWKNTFEMLPGVLLAFPYGFLSDRVGRKKIILTGMLGCVLSDTWARIVCWFPEQMPLRYLWLSGLWQIVGGGAATFQSLLYAIIAESTSPEHRVTAFSYLHAAALVAETLTVPISAFLMTVNPWIPFIMGPAVMVIIILLTMILIPGIRESDEDGPIESLGNPATANQDHDANLEALTSHGEQHLISEADSTTRSLTTVWTLSCIVLLFLTASIGRQSMGILLQYVTKRFHWTYAKASWLITLRAAIALVMLTIVLPGVSTTIVKRFHSSPKARDKRLTQLSCLLLSTGSFTVFTAGNPSLVVFGIILAASGSFFNATARGFVTALVSPNHLGAVYTGITVATYGGMLASGPLLAQVFHWGMKVGGLWTGLPFLVASGLFLVCLAAVSVIDL